MNFFKNLGGSSSSFVIMDESFLLNSTHYAWCSDKKPVALDLLELGKPYPTSCDQRHNILSKGTFKTSQLRYEKSNLSGFKNFFACQ